MRTSPNLLLGSLLLAACEDTGPSDTTSGLIEGTLLVATSTGGGNPDPDGYLLTVDGGESFPLTTSGTSEIRLRSGHHALRLSDIAEQCSVAQGVDLEVDVPPEGTTSVAFDLNCPGGAIQVEARTTGLDLDADGYGIEVDGTDRGPLDPNGQVLTRVQPGSSTISLTGLAPNCATEGPASRTVIVGDAEVVPVVFAVECTATSGAIEVIATSSGIDVAWSFRVTLDGADMPRMSRGDPYYLIGVPAGDHVVALVHGPSNCSVDPESHTITVTAGELVRDTVAVEFSVACTRPSEGSGFVRITAPTTGSLPSSTQFAVWYSHYGYWDYGGTLELLGMIEPDGSLVVELPASNAASGADPYWYDFFLRDIPPQCTVDRENWPQTSIMPGETVDVEFALTC